MRIRRMVLSQEARCRLCGGGGTNADIVDHIRSLAEGGTDERSNVQRLCRSCSASKTARESARARRR